MKFLSPNEPGLLEESSEGSSFVMPNAHLSRAGDEPNEEEGEGSGCEPVINTDSERGVWFPPRPFEGGTPMSLVGLGLEMEAAS
jgi:hypothetical protein